MKSSRNQSLIMIGVGLILISVLLAYFAFSQPKVSEYKESSSSSSAGITTAEEKGESALISTIAAVNNNDITKVSTSTTNSNALEEKATRASVSYPLNLNTCSIDELVTIDGLGETRADAILQYRDYLGGYTDVEQIKDIKGIGDALYEKVSPYLTV